MTDFKLCDRVIYDGGKERGMIVAFVDDVALVRLDQKLQQGHAEETMACLLSKLSHEEKA